jgi:hypothetical protein
MAVDYRGFSSTPQLVAKVTTDVANITAASVSIVSFTVPGSTPGQFFVVAAPDLDTGLAIGDAFCDTAGTVKVRIINPTIGDVNPVSQDFYFLGL